VGSVRRVRCWPHLQQRAKGFDWLTSARGHAGGLASGARAVHLPVERQKARSGHRRSLTSEPMHSSLAEDSMAHCMHTRVMYTRPFTSSALAAPSNDLLRHATSPATSPIARRFARRLGTARRPKFSRAPAKSFAPNPPPVPSRKSEKACSAASRVPQVCARCPSPSSPPGVGGGPRMLPQSRGGPLSLGGCRSRAASQDVEMSSPGTRREVHVVTWRRGMVDNSKYYHSVRCSGSAAASVCGVAESR
jgi:hypothetical protein